MGFKLFIIVILLVAGVYDWKYLSIPVWLLVLGVLGGFINVIYSCCMGYENPVGALAAMVPGIALLGLACLTREQVGYGDGVALLGMGGCMGGIELLYALMFALLILFFTSMVMVLCKMVKMQTRLPFVPFLALGSILTLGRGILFG